MWIETYFPARLNAFKRCPHRYYRRYVRHDLPIARITPALARGDVTHKLLAIALRHRQRGHDLPFDLRQRVAEDLHRGLYENPRDWEGDVEQVVKWINGAQAVIRHAGEILAVERDLDFHSRGSATMAPFRLRARLDLVLRHPDGAVEHLDWKTGGDYEDELQTIMSRIVLAHNYPHNRPRTYSTTMFLATGELRQTEFTREEVQTVWAEIRELIAAIRTERTWPALPNFSCGSCPLYEHGCPLFARLTRFQDTQ